MFFGLRKSCIKDYLEITAGTCLMGIAVASIYDPLGMVVGGFSGIAILVKHIAEQNFYWNVPLWLTNLLLNIPVFGAGWHIKGFRYIKKTAFATGMLSFWLWILPHWNLAQGDYMLAAIYGGVFSGVGLAMVFLAHASTGGTDMVATLLQTRFRRYSISQILQVLDGAVVIGGIFLFGWRAGLYAVIAVFAAAGLTDMILEGNKYAKAVFIITEHADEVSQAVMQKLHRGVTEIEAKGMYSNRMHPMLYCVVAKKQIVDLKQVILETDREAFVIVTDAREVLGEGFLEF
ncbi:MAG: YitT family protein [Lachnospiraceae bacterium]|nr:YitT family protein [Lachnospiraceae bacterium]